MSNTCIAGRHNTNTDTHTCTYISYMQRSIPHKNTIMYHSKSSAVHAIEYVLTGSQRLQNEKKRE